MNYMLLIDCILVAAGAGLIYGIFGGGSGLIMVPGYYYVLRHFSLVGEHRMQMAIATTAAASAILGFFSARVQWKAQNIDFHAAKKVSIGIAVGTMTAVLLLNVVPSAFLKHLFGVVVVFVAVWLWFYNQAKDLKKWSIASFANHVRTFFLGLLWFLLGVAVFTVPYLHKTGLSVRRSVGSATFLGTIFSAFAALLLMTSGIFQLGVSVTHIGYLNLLLLLLSVIPSSMAGHYGSKLSNKFPPYIMKKVYAGMICLVGIVMLV